MTAVNNHSFYNARQKIKVSLLLARQIWHNEEVNIIRYSMVKGRNIPIMNDNSVFTPFGKYTG